MARILLYEVLNCDLDNLSNTAWGIALPELLVSQDATPQQCQALHLTLVGKLHCVAKVNSIKIASAFG